MAIIVKNRDTAESIQKIFACPRRNKIFQIKYVKSVLNLSDEELNLILRNINIRRGSNMIYLRCYNDVPYVIVNELKMCPYDNNIDFDTCKENIFKAIKKFEKEHYC